MPKVLFGIFLGLFGGALELMMQVGPHDAATNFCNWSPLPPTCLRLLPDWFDKWGWFLPALVVVIGIILLFWPLARILWEQARKFRSSWRVQWPIQRKRGWPYDAETARRIFHIKSEVKFDKLLDEHRVQIELKFINGSNNTIIVDRVAGKIKLSNMRAIELETPRLEETSPPTRHTPLADFWIKLDQRIPNELCSQIDEYIGSGKTLSLDLTNLAIFLCSVDDGGEPFVVPRWQGITCTLKTKVIESGQLVIAFGGVGFEVGMSTIRR